MSLLGLIKGYNVNMEFASILKELRKSHGLSQMALSKQTGISQSAIAKWELGKTEPTATSLLYVAKFFNESVDYLLGLQS